VIDNTPALELGVEVQGHASYDGSSSFKIDVFVLSGLPEAASSFGNAGEHRPMQGQTPMPLDDRLVRRVPR
jgi:hypothetical protein